MKRLLPSLLAASFLCGGASAAAPPKKKPAPAEKTAAIKAAPAPSPVRKPVHPGPAWSVAFSPDGTRIAVGGYRKVTLYDAQTGAKQAEWVVSQDAVRTLAFSADGTRLAAGTGVPGVSGSAVVLDAASGKPVRTVSGHFDTVEAVAFAGNWLLSAGNDEKVRVTDLGSGKAVGVLGEHTGRCLSVAVPAKTTEADGGEIFATGGADNAVKIWDAKTRRVVVNFDQSQGPVWALAAFHNRPGRFVAGSGDGQVRFFGVRADRDGKAGERTGFVERAVNAHAGSVYAVAVAPSDAFLVSGGSDKKAVLWNAGGGKRREWTEAQGDVWGVAVSPDSKRVAAASLDGKTRVYEAESGKLIWELPLAPVPATPPASPAPPTENKPANPAAPAVASPRVSKN